MVCVAGESSVVCSIRVSSSRVRGPKSKLVIKPSTTVTEVFNHVANHYEYEPDSFELVLQCSHGEVIEMNEMKDKTLMDLKLDFSGNTKYRLLVTDMAGQPPKGATTDQKVMLYNDLLSFDRPAGDTPNRPFQPIEEFYSRYKSVFKSENSYVGLVNQAMTCYLNSLLQALYMTPEFRNALYHWEYVDGSEKDEAKSIPYQLQKLFLNLQTSTKSAVETTSLTKSFGWDSTEAWQQHDIQELCRVMFDALEQKFKNTQQADLINRLYEGKMIDYVKCLECSTEKSREDTFLDIPLPVRPFGSKVAYNSVEEALRAFVQPETLDGTNQYHCEKCNKKCDAHKGLKFSKFPYLLTLHLKRFDFDYNTLHRIKLNDKVTFPDLLNLNSFVASSSAAQESPGGEEDAGVGVKCDDSSTTDSGTLDDECPPCESSSANSNQSANNDQDDDEGIDVSNGPSTSSCSSHNNENEKNFGNRLGDKGPYVYELFSIMIHSGSASGGHYYAYIKDLMTQEWFCFNDQSVTKITYEDIQKTYGGGPTRAYYSGAYSSSTNAYMLMYRQIDPSRNTLPMQAQNFPKHIQDLLKKMKESEENDRKNREKQMSMCKLKVYCHHPVEGCLVDVKVLVLQDETLLETTDLAYRKLALEGVVKSDQCRLVSYDHNEDLIERSWEGAELLEPIGDIWRNNSQFDFLLEIRRKDEQFETYLPGGVSTKVFVVDIDKEQVVDGPIIVRGLLTQTVKEYKQQLSKILKIDAKQMKLIVQKYLSDTNLLDKDDNMLKSEGFYGSSKIFVATALDNDDTKPFHESKLYKIIENFDYIISLKVLLPDTSKETLEDLNIPSLEEKLKEQEKLVTNGPSKLANDESQKETQLKNYEQTKGSVGAEETQTKVSAVQSVEGEDWNTPEQSNSEDSSLSDSERTLMGDTPDYGNCVQSPSSNTEKVNAYQPYNPNHIENWDVEDESEYYFKAVPHSEDSVKLLRVLVDKRMQLSTLKKDLEPLVGVPVEYFKVFRHSSDSGETECSRLTEQLSCYQDGERLRLQLGRALRSGEFKVKLFQLLIHSTEPFKFLCDWIVSKEMTVGQAKKEILAEIKRKYDIDIPYEKCRLRRKNYKAASKVFLDEEKFEELRLHTQCEIIIQELPDKETVKDSNQLCLFVRKWSPSEMQLSPLEEITINGRTIDELKKKLSSISDIPQEYVEVAKVRNSFPCDISVLQVQTDLNWNNDHQRLSTTIDAWPLNLEDGSALYFRDSREKLKTLSVDEFTEIASKENSRLMSQSSAATCSPRRERALKIYLDSK
ncbi:ubiquitin carboxyl-terminal hydrolase 47 isoform X2 [Athalia rosae]|nr:ubiquitin carboxyl-terminal hydrolase 47 isoform X2 [Athalia rosae]XP_048515225.1 ubiquitin carboxyl-terminal hydrolase 47 isoform X2 [Athalia rosae]XP_048515226.1 ubiquitin carboxyl-terminal hydrolase 47 isoform X2 [Athalia rosae]XP_048515227.1 ubiquitin carboxyl-terminal hydrolase 47 isoform X2 [Athalia rosae]XP_048515228.1 ubiquitin carboxyl-terminal hydrolase 47 isoform X2 [Athalia rosae]XP_048515230.1 ubiquitin carboxyl-terminal hydrolase 47 isoform X2 [Athalia rosae]